MASDIQRADADRVGLGWRGELAAGIFANLDRIDLVELIADDHFKASARELRPLKLLASQVPVTLHGVAMGLAGGEPVAPWRLDAMARLVETLGAVSWSEHLAFVRAGGHEIGHLAMPPRTARGTEAAVRHVEQAARVVGRAPLLENIATLVEPPGSALDEPAWTSAIVQGSGAPMLMDLHNLYANAVNFGRDPFAMLDAMPLDAVRAVHLSGGHWIDEPVIAGSTTQLPAACPAPSQEETTQPAAAARPRQRLLDDHVHDVPRGVFDLLEHLACRAAGPLDVIIERDGRYPAFEVLLQQLDAARVALARGRARALAATTATASATAVASPARAAAPRARPAARPLCVWSEGLPTGYAAGATPAERFLARLYAEPARLAQFVAAPDASLAEAGLDAHDVAAWRAADRVGLAMAVRSYARKRECHAKPREQAWTVR